MAFVNELLFKQGFTGTSTTVTHNLDRLNLGYRVVCSGSSRPDLVRDIIFTSGNERNEFVIRLNSSNVGVIQVLDDNRYSANLPTPENFIKLVNLPQPDDIPNTLVTGFTYNDANTFTISNNDGTSFNSSINIMTGFTVNNGVGDGFVTINSTSGQELEINQRGVNFNYSTPNIQVGTTGANMMIGSTGGIGSYPSGSYPGLNLNTTTGNIFLFNGGYGGTGAVMDFQGGNIRDIHDIQSSSNWPLKLYGGPGPNDGNDGIQMYTADNLNVYTKKFEIKADTGTPNAYFTNINNFGINTITPQHTLDVNGTTRLLGLTANTLNLVTDLSIANGGTGQSNAQDAINELTQVSSATNEHVLTKDTSTGNATWKAGGGGTDKFVSGATYSEPTTAEPKIAFVGNSSETTFNVLTNVFGTYYDSAESLNEQTNNTTTYSTALSLTTDTVPDGIYRIGWSYEWRGDTREDFEARVQVDGGTVMEVNMEAKDNSNYYGIGGFANQTFGSNGTHTINFDFRSEANGDIMRVRNLRLEFYRVSSVSG